MGQKRGVCVCGQGENWHWRCRLLLQCSPSSSSLLSQFCQCRDPGINLHSLKEVWSIQLYLSLLYLAAWNPLRALICRDDCCKEAISPPVEAVPCMAHRATELRALQQLKWGQVGKYLSPILLNLLLKNMLWQPFSDICARWGHRLIPWVALLFMATYHHSVQFLSLFLFMILIAYY